MPENYNGQDKNSIGHPVEWVAEDFDIELAVSSIDGPIVEVGGPVLDDGEAYSIIPQSAWKVLEKKKEINGSYISNIDTEWHEEVHGYKPRLDFLADAQRMPLKDGSLGMVLASCLDRDIRKGTIKESYRVLASGGLLVLNGTFKSDAQYAIDAGFELVAYKSSEDDMKIISQDASRKYSLPRQIIFLKK